MSFEKFNFLDSLRNKTNKIVNESKLPHERYDSTVGVYGGKLKMKDNKMVWDNKGIISKIDKFGDAILRTYDEHLVKNMKEMFKRDPKLFFRFLAPGTKRYRGSREEIFSNIQKLGLEDIYGLHEDGIEIKNQDLFTKGVALQDIFRADLITDEKLQKIDKISALEQAGKYLHQVHEEHGGIGEVLVSDIIFQEESEGKVDKATLNIPDIIYNPDKEIGEKEKKATDLLDFIISVGAEDFRATQGDLESMRKSMKTILESYQDPGVISLLQSFIKRGRLVLAGDKLSRAVNIPADSFTTKNRALFSKHNEARVVNDRELEAKLKDTALEICEEVLAK